MLVGRPTLDPFLMLSRFSLLAALLCSASAVFAAPQILHWSNGSEPSDIDPQVITGIPEHKIVTALIEGLVAEDPKDLHPVPGVAESWEISADGLLYTFHLRADAKWSNGTPVTAQDFVRSWQRALTPSLGDEYSYMIYNYVVGAKDYFDGKIKDFSQVGFAAPDARTVTIKLMNATPYLLTAMNHYAWFPVPIAVVEKFGGLAKRGTAWTRAENFVGNGPFVIKEWRQNQKLILARSPTYWDRANVKLDEIHLYPIDNLDVEERMFRTGALHETYEIPTAKIDTYRKNNPAALRTDPYLGTYFYRFNTARKPFDDVRVRRALSLAIDREAIVKNITRGGELPAYAVSYPGTAGYAPRAKITGTLDEARRLLAEAGFPGGKGFPVTELLYNTQQNHRMIAEAIQQMWRKNLGIEITLRNEEWKVYIDAQHVTHDFTIQRAGWIADYCDPHVFLDMWETGGGNNDTQWGSPEYDKLLHTALSAKTQEERYEIYQKMDQILCDQVPVMPIYYYTRAHLVSPKVKGFYPTLLDNHPWKYVYVEE